MNNKLFIVLVYFMIILNIIWVIIGLTSVLKTTMKSDDIKPNKKEEMIKNIEIVNIIDIEEGLSIDLDIDGEIHNYIWINK